MSEPPAKLIDLFEKATSSSLKQPDVGINLEIIDRMNARRRYCIEALEYFKQLFRSGDLKTVSLTLSLLETCVKNCKPAFHKYIDKRDLMPSIMNLLRRRRQKLGIIDKMAGLYKAPGWREIEDRVLALIQLWYDTFMMHEDEYPCFIKAYKELRIEEIKFPPRDPNERYMIHFEGEPSPAFELADIEEQLRPKEEETPQLTSWDVQTLRNGLSQLEDIVKHASEASAFQDPKVREVVRNTRIAQRKLVWVTSYMTESSNTELLEIMDFVNAKMDSFKIAARMIKRNAKREDVLEVLNINQEEKALDEDFLSEMNYFERLEQLVNNREELNQIQETNPQAVIETPADRDDFVEKENEVIQQHVLPDLLFGDRNIEKDLQGIDFGQNYFTGQNFQNQSYFTNQPSITQTTEFNTQPVLFTNPVLNAVPVNLTTNPNNPFERVDTFEDFFTGLANRNNQ